ncbi:12004_t:CDS:2, partial [Racocetra fulgida]
MAWEEHLYNAEKIHKTVTTNHITDSNNCENQLESSFEQRNEINNPIALDLNENMHILILDDAIIRELTKDGDNENEDFEELATTSNMQNCHSAKHEGSKIELKYLFTHALSQLLFVRTLQAREENWTFSYKLLVDLITQTNMTNMTMIELVILVIL